MPHPVSTWLSHIKQRIKSWQHSPHAISRTAFHLLRLGKLIGIFAVNARYRSEQRIGWGKKEQGRHQRSTHTARNRYPLLFQEARNHLEQVAHPKILSFGCSTGEEVATLGEYFPQATLMGVDINPWCIKQCQINFRHARYAFSHRFAREFEEAGNFDAIFCLAVLQRTENRTRTNSAHAEGFLFSHFEQEITLLDQKLKPGGLLIIDHTDFRFTETVCGPRYQPIEFKNNRLLRKRPLFDRNNRKISDTTHEYRVFVKQGST